MTTTEERNKQKGERIASTGKLATGRMPRGINLRATMTVLCACYVVAFSRNRGVSCRQESRRTHHVPHRFRNIALDANNPDWRPMLRTESAKSRQESQNSLMLLQDPASYCDENTPVVTFSLNKNGPSGGFGDRLRGMVTTSYLAVMTNSSFAVHWTHPYNLSDYFIVPSCNAHESHDRIPSMEGTDVGSLTSTPLPANSVITRTAIDDWKYFSDFSFMEDAGRNVEIHTNSFHWKEVVRHPAFRERAASLGLSNLTQAELFKLAIDQLLQSPTSVVRESFDSVRQRLAAGSHTEELPANVPYIGVQIRLGGRNSGAVSGWDDLVRHSLEDVDCFAAEAVRLCHKMHIKSIFVTADSDEAVRKFEDAVAKESARECSSCPPQIVVQVPGSIAHTDRSIVASEHAGDVWLKSILDWWALKHAAALVISRSGFGETAAFSSDAETARRLKFSSAAAGASSQAGDTSDRCEFEDFLEYDKEIF